MIMTIKREVFGMRGECLLKIQMKIEEKNVSKFRTIMNTFSIDENFFQNCDDFNLAMENVLKGLPDKVRDQLSRHHIQMHFKSNEIYTFLNHFQIARSWR
jgi:hypothetical protein